MSEKLLAEFPDCPESQVLAIAKKLAQQLLPGRVLCLKGDLGAGKTTFAKSFISNTFSCDPETLLSPTFTYVNTYQAESIETRFSNIHHFDLYRIQEEQEFIDLGLEEMLYEQDSVSLIEWPEKIASLLPSSRLELKFEHKNETKRSLSLFSVGKIDETFCF